MKRMSRTPNHMYRVSERLSEVMDDIGVNERLVMKRRRAHMLMENIITLALENHNSSYYHFGSQSEGSTTLGLGSDSDILVTVNISDITQNVSERKPGVGNLMMIQNENISPGYCYLQYIRPSLPLSETVKDIGNKLMEHCVTDSDGRLLAKNTLITKRTFKIVTYTWLYRKLQINGPALTQPEEPGIHAFDTVTCCFCESSPHQVTSWLQKQRECKWPTEDVLEKFRNAGCFVVAVGSKVAYDPELEWRISTSLQERYLMFSLNITQLRCYILMKMILKTHINQYVEDVLSSFMCKNVLLHCIANSSHDWHTGNLLSYLHLCLFMLKECVEQRNCPHFMITENNLLAGRMTDKQRGKLLDIINNLMKKDEQFLYEIQMDALGIRLKMMLNMIIISPCSDFLQGLLLQFTCSLVSNMAACLGLSINLVLKEIERGSLEMALRYLLWTTSKLERHRRVGDLYRRTASELLIPLVSSILGSVLASSNIASHTAISDEAFTYLEAGKESDALSGRLKLVSVLYCTGDMERAERVLRIIETQYDISELHNTCGCYTIRNKTSDLRSGTIYACDKYSEMAIKSHFAVCTRFLQCEINCVPHELRYEILRYNMEENKQRRTGQDSLWMDYIVVDSIPYFHFLQYKIYGHLQRRTEQEEALCNLAQSINFLPILGHKETAFNLLGQCYEQENRQTEAFLCYIRSLKHRGRNNAASLLLCVQLFKLWKQYNAL